MMCPAGCLSSSVSCAALVLLACRFPIRFLIRLVPRSAVRVVPRFALSRLAASPRLISSACSARYRYARSPRSAYRPRFSCRRAGRPASRSHLVMRFACRPACLLTVLRLAHPRGVVADVIALLASCAVADVIASFMRFVATVPPPPRLACAVWCFSRCVCAILFAVAMGAIGWGHSCPVP